MGIASHLILEYRSAGYGNGHVFIHTQRAATSIYYGPAAKQLYESMKEFCKARNQGSGEYYEQETSGGLQWRERI